MEDISLSDVFCIIAGVILIGGIISLIYLRIYIYIQVIKDAKKSKSNIV